MAISQPSSTNIMLRVIATLALIAVLGFCVFGFLAGNEFTQTAKRIPQQMVYGVVGLACLVGMFRLVRRIALPVALAFVCCSCSMLLVDTIPTKPGAAMAPGADRKDLAAVLGPPMSSNTLPIPASARLLQTNVPPCVCYTYRVSGLVQIGGDEFTGDWNLYPVLVIMTLGVAEVIAFPYVSVDLAAMSLKRHELRVWYDCSDHLVAYDRRRWADRKKTSD